MTHIDFATATTAYERARRDPPILIVPGLGDSGPRHWQSHWEKALPTARRVVQSDWDRPNLGFWTGTLLEAVREQPGAILVAHSLGCATIAHLARINGGRGIAGALLVAPADVDRDVPRTEDLRAFSPLPRQRFDQQRVLGHRKNVPAVGLAVPARHPGEAVGDVVELDVKGRGVEQIEPAARQHALPGSQASRAARPSYWLLHLRFLASFAHAA